MEVLDIRPPQRKTKALGFKKKAAQHQSDFKENVLKLKYKEQGYILELEHANMGYNF